MALEHAGEAVAASPAVGSPDRPDGAGDVGGAVGILAARIDQVDAARLELAVGLLARPGNGRSRRCGPAPEIVSKRQVAQVAGRRRRNCVQLLGGGQSRRAPPLGASTDSQCRKRASAAPSRACAARWPAMLDRVLDRLGQHDGIAQRSTIVAPPASSAAKIAATARSGSTATRLPVRAAERAARRRRGRAMRTALPRCARDLVGHLLGRDEQVGGAVGVERST